MNRHQCFVKNGKYETPWFFCLSSEVYQIKNVHIESELLQICNTTSTTEMHRFAKMLPCQVHQYGRSSTQRALGVSRRARHISAPHSLCRVMQQYVYSSHIGWRWDLTSKDSPPFLLFLHWMKIPMVRAMKPHFFSYHIAWRWDSKSRGNSPSLDEDSHPFFLSLHWIRFLFFSALPILDEDSYSFLLFLNWMKIPLRRYLVTTLWWMHHKINSTSHSHWRTHLHNMCSWQVFTTQHSIALCSSLSHLCGSWCSKAIGPCIPASVSATLPG
jgi:hypothetical protein